MDDTNDITFNLTFDDVFSDNAALAITTPQPEPQPVPQPVPRPQPQPVPRPTPKPGPTPITKLDFAITQTELNALTNVNVNKTTFEKFSKYTKTDDTNRNTYKYFINYDNMRPIHEKITNFKTTLLPMNHEINMKEKGYRTVYITSDIHADIRKLLSLLIAEGIISIEIKEGFYPYSDDIYNKPFIEHINFLKNNMLFIILGDLIDGKRHTSVDDPVGNFELILHIFLFNMRLKARDKNSEVLFTIGNHDYDGVIFKKGTESNLYQYRHVSSIRYFDLNTNESNYSVKDAISAVLLPFYEISPYFILFLKYDDKIEFKCIHAGFHDTKSNKNNTDALETFQKTINETGLLVHAQTNTNYLTLLGADTDTINPNGGLWSRAYATIECNTLKANDTNENTTIVVGHCPTNHTKSRIVTKNMYAISTIEDIDKQPNYLYCNKSTDISKDSKGCVVADCFTNLIPKLIFVDTAMSEAFIMQKTDANIYRERGIEFLLLEYKKENEKQNTTRWINTISRKPAGKVDSSKTTYPNYNPIQLYPPVKLK